MTMKASRNWEKRRTCIGLSHMIDMKASRLSVDRVIVSELVECSIRRDIIYNKMLETSSIWHQQRSKQRVVLMIAERTITR